MNLIQCICGLLLVFIAVACQTKEQNHNADSQAVGELLIDFNHVVGTQELVLDTATYANAQGESYQVNILKYYISNIQLTNTKGEIFTYPKSESYFLISEAEPATKKIKLVDIPEGDYDHFTFTIGVDSTKSVAGVEERVGVLDVANPKTMYWSWNTGYIFFMLEGTSPAAPDSTGNQMKYHIGFFGGYDASMPPDAAPRINNVKKRTLDLEDTPLRIRSAQPSNVQVKVDVNRLFTGEEEVSIATHPVVMTTPYSKVIANNYVEAFQVDFVKNSIEE